MIDFGFKIIIILIYLSFIFIIIEYGVSAFKKDKRHRLRGTISNTLNAIFMKAILGLVVAFYFSILVKLYFFLGHTITSPVTIINFLACLLLVDFSYFALHIFHHKIKILWAIHSVHHSDDKFNFSTAYRLSWLEKCYNITIFIPAILIGFNPYLASLSFAIMSIYDFFCHSSYIKFPRFLGYIFVLPQTHIIHHDQEIKHQNSNFGAMFSIWDRMFGTYIEKIDNLQLGIKNYKEDGFFKMQIDPIKKYIRENL